MFTLRRFLHFFFHCFLLSGDVGDYSLNDNGIPDYQSKLDLARDVSNAMEQNVNFTRRKCQNPSPFVWWPFRIMILYGGEGGQNAVRATFFWGGGGHHPRDR